MFAQLENSSRRWSFTTKASVSSRYGSEKSISTARSGVTTVPGHGKVDTARRQQARQRLQIFHLDEFDLDTKIAGKELGHFHVEADKMALPVNEYKGKAISQHAHAQNTAFLIESITDPAGFATASPRSAGLIRRASWWVMRGRML